jgi:hypothetical protein
MRDIPKEPYIDLAGGRIPHSLRRENPFALNGDPLATEQGPRIKRSGPQTPEGLARCAKAKTKHGRDTKQMRERRRMLSAALRLVIDRMYEQGYLNGPKQVGRKPGPLARPEEVWSFIEGLRCTPPGG